VEDGRDEETKGPINKEKRKLLREMSGFFVNMCAPY